MLMCVGLYSMGVGEDTGVVRVAVEEWVPHVAVTRDDHGNITIRGPMANLLMALSQALNFRYILVYNLYTVVWTDFLTISYENLAEIVKFQLR